MAILDNTYLIGDNQFWLVDEDPSVVSIPESLSGDLIYYQVSETSPKVLFYKTTDGDTTDVQQLTVRNKSDATTDPLATDDVSQGFAFGSKWYNQTSGTLFVCVSSAFGTAVWKQTAS